MKQSLIALSVDDEDLQRPSSVRSAAPRTSRVCGPGVCLKQTRVAHPESV